jgi:hypothetical protein
MITVEPRILSHPLIQHLLYVILKLFSLKLSWRKACLVFDMKERKQRYSCIHVQIECDDVLAYILVMILIWLKSGIWASQL